MRYSIIFSNIQSYSDLYEYAMNMYMNMVYLYELKGNHITIEYCSQGRHYDIF